MHFSLRKGTVGFLVVLALAPLLVYLPSVLRDAFVSIDDGLLITKNAAVRALTPGTIFHIFTSYDPELYIPLTFLSYQFEFALVGAHPILFHFDNLLLHIGSVLVLFLLLRRMFGRDEIAFVGALLFALHPLHAEAVAWAAARKDLLSTFLFLASLHSYERWRGEERSSLPWRSLGLFLLALLSKVTVAMLPLVLLLLDWRRGEHLTLRTLRQKLPFFAMSAFFIVIALFGKAKGIGSLGMHRTVLLALKGTAFYVQKFMAPTHLSVIYAQQTDVTIRAAEFWIPLLVVLLLIGCLGIALKRSYRNVAFGVAFFLLTLVPNFANFWKNRLLFFASDRYAYIPSIGLIVVVCSVLLWILRNRPRWRIGVVGISLAVSALFALFTFQQARVWQSDIDLYQNVLRWYPDSTQAANNLGDALFRAGKLDEALAWFAIVAQEDPSYIQAIDNAGKVETQRGNYDKARAWYERGVAAIGSDPRQEDLAPRYLLGELFINMGKTEDGLAQYKAAAETLPTIAEPYYNWGVQLHKLNRGDEAIPLFEKAISFDPNDIDSRYHLAGLYAERGRLAEAKNQLEAVIEIDPGYEKAAAHLAGIRRLLER